MSRSDEQSFWRLYGLAVRAGKVISGTDAVRAALPKKKGYLLLLAADSSEAVIVKLQRQAGLFGIDCLILADKLTIGKWTGKEQRVCALVTDKGFADRLIEISNSLTQVKDAEAE